MAKNKIMLVSEAWSEKDAEAGTTLVPWFLNSLLSQIGIRASECYMTAVFHKECNDVKKLCGPKSDGIPGLPALIKGKFVLSHLSPELDRLYEEIKREQPNVIVALGATAAWALLRTAGIKAIRGATLPTHQAVSQRLSREFKVFPTYHPSAITREWSLRPVALSDLAKVKDEAAFPEVRRPQRFILIEPTLQDLAEYEERINAATRLSIDIETKGDQITCIGFAPSTDHAIVIPFWSADAPQGNYWRTLEEELLAWDYVRRWCSSRPSVFQNGLYDIHFLWRRYGIICQQADHDTMLLHHAMQPEMEKGLGFLATLYTNEASWKFMARVGTSKKAD